MTSLHILGQETIEVQTLTYDSTGRDYMFDFPADDGTTYERILMLYNMRCKGAQVSVPGNVNLGCGEWDYSCNTYIVDSTYTDSLSATHPTHIIPGFSGDVFDYTTSPTNVYYQYDQKETAYLNTISENEYQVGIGNEQLAHPFNGQKRVAKTQYIWTAEELLDEGIGTNAISGVKLELDGESTYDFLRIKMMNTAETNPSTATILSEDLQQVYFLNSTLDGGTNYFKFYDNFEWDGMSNVLMEISYTNENASEERSSKGSDATDGVGLSNSGDNGHLIVAGEGYVTLPNNGLDQVSNEVTISLWSYGDESVMPVNSTIFEGVDNNNNRQANVHLPWGNGQVYWDCGYSGSYDRINKTANPEDFRGKWNHWAFTKNSTTGEMKIYLNGTLWHSGTGKFRPINISRMNLGSDANGNNKYFGKIDEFRVWNKELDEATISAWMSRKVDATHPNYANLQSYITLNEGDGTSVSNAAQTGGTGQINGKSSWASVRGNQLQTDFVAVNQRPNVTFVSGEYGLDISTVQVIDTVENLAKEVTEYKVVGTDIEIESSFQAWEAADEPMYAEDGSIVNSFPIAVEGTIQIGSLDYYRKLPSRFEIMSFVTPYGIYLDLGEEGKTWTFDVTDFAPILTGRKRMYLTLGGQFQEEMDIKFVFIKGTPPRDVLDIRQIWRSGRSTNNAQIRNDDVFAPVDVQLHPFANYYKIRSTITGHGQEGEFIPRWHEVKINGEIPFSWRVWTECGNNPVFPQGGTWVYDRAGWCPGQPSDLNHFDITPLVEPGTTVNIDYDMFQASGDSRYIVNHQLVTYGAPNFLSDARIADVMRPSNKVEYQRVNPVCNAPIVVLENTGLNTLTSATITYYVHGGNKLTYDWSGSLEFLEREEIELPLPDMGFWLGSGQTNFIAEVSNPNGVLDEYEQNNVFVSPFDVPDIINEEAILMYTFTNNNGFENSLTYTDFNQDTIIYRAELENNWFYIDSLFLDDGCYTLHVTDSGDNGLSFWHQPNQGSGSINLLTLDEDLIQNFEPDFGQTFTYSFVKGQFTNVELEPASFDFKIYPNPNNGVFRLSFSLEKPEDLKVLVVDVKGKTVFSRNLSKYSSSILELDMPELESGLYYCTVISGNKVSTRKMVVEK